MGGDGAVGVVVLQSSEGQRRQRHERDKCKFQDEEKKNEPHSVP